MVIGVLQKSWYAKAKAARRRAVPHVITPCTSLPPSRCAHQNTKSRSHQECTHTTGKTQNADGQGLRRRPNVGAVDVDSEQASSPLFFFFWLRRRPGRRRMDFLFFSGLRRRPGRRRMDFLFFLGYADGQVVGV